MVGLQPVEEQEFREKGARRKPQSPLHVRREHDELALLGPRRNLSFRGSAGSHVARHPQEPVPAELPEGSFASYFRNISFDQLLYFSEF